jgi:4-alpha-glucanotransferase
MSTTGQNTPTGKPGRRNRKATQRNQAPVQLKRPQPDLTEDVKEQTVAAVSTDAASIGASPIGEAMPADASPLPAVAAADGAPISLRTIANAHSAYTWKSLEETRSFVEKLTGVRSLDKAMEVQTQFAKQAYETFVTDSQKIFELYSELAKHSLKPLQGLVARATEVRL